MKERFNIFSIILLLGIAFPCNCLEFHSPELAYLESDVVFSGKVTRIDLSENKVINVKQ